MFGKHVRRVAEETFGLVAYFTLTHKSKLLLLPNEREPEGQFAAYYKQLCGKVDEIEVDVRDVVVGLLRETDSSWCR